MKTISALIFAAIASPVLADGHMATFTGSTVKLAPTTEPGAAAEVQFYNRESNGPRDQGSRETLTLGGLSVGITFTWQANEDGDDRITVETDDNHFAHPDELTVEENGTGKVLIIPKFAEGV